jgi:hypothetical protein
MQEVNLYKIFIERFNRAEIKYMVTGSLASITYGEPRMTHDIDLVIKLDENKIKDLSRIFPSNEFYLPPAEIIGIENKKELRGHFNIVHFESGFKADVYISSENKLEKWGMNNVREYQFYGEKIYLAPPEYVIIMKMAYYIEGGSEKHINDIKSILKYSKDLVDFNILNSFIQDYRLEAAWSRIAYSHRENQL